MQQQKLCLKWNNHTVNLLSELETYQQKDILVDVTISCEGRNIKAHKMVLSACSPYFQNIFLENPCQHPIVIINGMKYEDITAILNFMYKGEVNVSHDGLSSFLQAAEALKVKGLAEVCGEKKSTSSNSQESEPVEQARPQRTETPTKKRHRNRKRSFSDSNRSDDEGTTVPRKHKEPNSPEVHELSGDESYTGDMSSNNGQSMNSRVPQNMYTRSHQSSSSVISHVEDMEDEFEIEPSKLLEQTLTTENVSMNNSSSDNSLRIERIMGNATEMESSSLQEPESPPDIKPIIEYGESSAGPSEGSMLVYNEQSQPGPSNVQDSSLLHDNSHTQELFTCDKCERVFTVMQAMLKHKQRHKSEGSEKKHSCNICFYSTNYASHLRQHIYTHTGERPFKCTHCTAGFTQNSLLKKHLLTHERKAAEPNQSIKQEPEETENKQAKKHNSEAAENKPAKKYEPKEAETKQEAVGAENKQTKTPKPEAVESKPTKKYEQEETETKQPKNHEPGGVEDKPSSTEPSTNKLQKKHELKDAKTKQPEKYESGAAVIKNLKCDRCSKTYGDTKLLLKHMRIHRRDDKPHRCTVCSKRFSKASYLKKHEKKHSQTAKCWTSEED